MADSPQRPKPPEDLNPWKTAGLVMGLGTEFAVCVVLGWWLGALFDERNGTSYGYLTGVIVGLVAGVGTAVGLVWKFAGKRRP